MMPPFIEQAKGFWERFRGIHVVSIPDRALYFPHCNAIHTIGVSNGVWVLFLDQAGRPLGLWRYVKANRIAVCCAAKGVLETRCIDEKKRHSWWMALLDGGVDQFIVPPLD